MGKVIDFKHFKDNKRILEKQEEQMDSDHEIYLVHRSLSLLSIDSILEEEHLFIHKSKYKIGDWVDFIDDKKKIRRGVIKAIEFYGSDTEIFYTIETECSDVDFCINENKIEGVLCQF